jgi:hypothetical protein
VERRPAACSERRLCQRLRHHRTVARSEDLSDQLLPAVSGSNDIILPAAVLLLRGDHVCLLWRQPAGAASCGESFYGGAWSRHIRSRALVFPQMVGSRRELARDWRAGDRVLGTPSDVGCSGLCSYRRRCLLLCALSALRAAALPVPRSVGNSRGNLHKINSSLYRTCINGSSGFYCGTTGFP